MKVQAGLEIPGLLAKFWNHGELTLTKTHIEFIWPHTHTLSQEIIHLHTGTHTRTSSTGPTFLVTAVITSFT